MTNKELAELIIKHVGGKDNVLSVTSCITRCRVEVKDVDKVDTEAIKASEDVMGLVIEGNQIQVIIGPGKNKKVAQEVAKALGISTELVDAKEFKSQINAKNQTPFKALLKKCASVFIPILPAIIACGLINGLNNTFANLIPAYGDTTIRLILAAMGSTVFSYLPIFVGISAARVFGGSMFVGGVLAGIFQSTALNGLSLFGVEMQAGRGGIIAVLLVVAFGSWVEKQLRKVVPDIIDIFATPILTILIAGFLGLILIQPVGGWLSDLIVSAIYFGLEKGGFIFGFLMSSLWLPLVATGLHNGVTPIKAELMTTIGHVPIQVMCAFVGAGQIGVVAAIYLKTKNKRLKKVIVSGTPVQLLGIGEPLIYGVTLPLLKPFIYACLSAGVGGGLSAVLGLTSYGYGLSGLLITLNLNKPLIYLMVFALVIVIAFVVTWVLGFDDLIQD